MSACTSEGSAVPAISTALSCCRRFLEFVPSGSFGRATVCIAFRRDAPWWEAATPEGVWRVRDVKPTRPARTLEEGTGVRPGPVAPKDVRAVFKTRRRHTCRSPRAFSFSSRSLPRAYSVVLIPKPLAISNSSGESLTWFKLGSRWPPLGTSRLTGAET